MAQGKPFTAEERQIIVKSLEPFLKAGLSRNKACEAIGLKPQTLSVWVQDDESLLMTLRGWENSLNVLAMANIASALEKESEMDDTRKETSKWWLERRMRNEFATKTETQEESDVNITYKWANENDNNTIPAQSVGEELS
jgi:hypothetical protein